MAVRVLPHSSARPVDHANPSVPGLVLALALVPLALDLLRLVQPGLGAALGLPLLLASGLAVLSLAAVWVRFPRAAWLLAASFAALAAFALQWVGADIAPILTLLSVVALGVGGAFAGGPETPETEISPAGV